MPYVGSSLKKSNFPLSTAFENEENIFTSPQDFDDYLSLKKISAPSSPASGRIKLYGDIADNKVKVKKSDGTVIDIELGAGAGGTDDHVIVREAGSLVGSVSRKLNFIRATDFDLAEDVANDEIEIQIASNAITDALIATHTTTKISTTNKALLNSAILYNDVDNDLGTHYIQIGVIAAPGNPAAGKHRLYIDTADSHLKRKNSAGTVVDYDSGAGGGEANTASNLGAGQGWYKTKVGVQLQFRSITATSNKIALANNTNDVGIDVTEANLTHDNIGGLLSISKGGTGQSTKTEGFDALSPMTTIADMIYFDGSNAVRLPKGTAGQILAMNGGATAPVWSNAGGGGSGAPDITGIVYVATDGSGDYTTLAAAITAEGTRKLYILGPGDHSLTVQLSSTLSDIWIRGCGVGVTRLLIENGVGTTNAGIVFKGSTGSQRLLTVNALRESHTLTFNTGHGFTTGDWLILRREVVVQSNGNGGKDAEIHKVKSATSTVVTLEDYIYEDYTTALTAAAYEITWCKNLTISDLSIVENRTSTSVTAMDDGGDSLFMYCYNLHLRNIVFEKMFYCSVAIQSCYHVQTDNVGYESPQFLNIDHTGTYWVNYGIDVLNASTNVTINGGWANRCRHSVTTDIIGGQTFIYGRQRNITINGMKSYNSNLSHFDSHEGAVGLTLNGCVAIGGYSQRIPDYQPAAAGDGLVIQQTDQVKGFTARSPTAWTGCIAQNCEQGGFEVAGDDPYSVGTDLLPGGDGSSMVNCSVIATQGGDAGSSGGGGARRAVRINTHRKGVKIKDCLFKNIAGIVIRLNEDVSLGGHTPPSSIIIEGNTFHSCGADLSSTYGLIWGDAGCNDLLVKNNVFGVGTAPASAYPLKLAGTINRMVFEGNSVNGLTNKMPQFAAASTDIRIRDNPGLNPTNKITNHINNTNSTIGTYGGTTATPTTATNYTVVGSDIILTVTGGSGVTVAIKDGSGSNTVSSEAPPVNGRYVPVGYKVQITFSSAPTVTVFGV